MSRVALDSPSPGEAVRPPGKSHSAEPHGNRRVDTVEFRQLRLDGRGIDVVRQRAEFPELRAEGACGHWPLAVVEVGIFPAGVRGGFVRVAYSPCLGGDETVERRPVVVSKTVVQRGLKLEFPVAIQQQLARRRGRRVWFLIRCDAGRKHDQLWLGFAKWQTECRDAITL